ncbi:MAG TPA: NrsF family protein [Polyangia bacterium]
MTSPPDLKARVLETIRREPSPTRAQASRQTKATIAAALIVDVALFVFCGGVHAGLRPTKLVLLTYGGGTALALLAVWGAFGRGRSMLGRPKRWLVAITIATPIALWSWMHVWSVIDPESAIASSGRVGLRCLALSLAFAAWPLGLLLRSLREKNPLTSVETGAARGVAIGALASVLVGLWCAQTSASHLVIGHALPLVLLSVLGGWLGGRMSGVAGGAARAG